MSRIAVRAETVNVTAHRVGLMQYLILLLGSTRVITSQKLLQRVAVML